MGESFSIPAGLNGGKLRPDGTIDMNTLSSPLLLRRVRQAAEPTPAAGEILIWSDSDDDSVWLVYNDADAGVVTIQLT
jgi:hypothetical protein